MLRGEDGTPKRYIVGAIYGWLRLVNRLIESRGRDSVRRLRYIYLRGNFGIDD